MCYDGHLLVSGQLIFQAILVHANIELQGFGDFALSPVSAELRRQCPCRMWTIRKKCKRIHAFTDNITYMLQFCKQIPIDFPPY